MGGVGLVLLVLWVRSSSLPSSRSLTGFTLPWLRAPSGPGLLWLQQGLFRRSISFLPWASQPHSANSDPSSLNEVEETMTETHQQEWKKNVFTTPLEKWAHYQVTVWIHYSSSTNVLWIALYILICSVQTLRLYNVQPHAVLWTDITLYSEQFSILHEHNHPDPTPSGYPGFLLPFPHSTSSKILSIYIPLVVSNLTQLFLFLFTKKNFC